MPMVDLGQCLADMMDEAGTLTPSAFEEQSWHSNRQPQRTGIEEKWQLPYGTQVPVYGQNARLPQYFQNDLEEFVEY